MSGYGKVISGGKAMTNGVTKGINDKLKVFSNRNERAKMLAVSVRDTFNTQKLSEPHLNNINVSASKKFTTPKLPSKV